MHNLKSISTLNVAFVKQDTEYCLWISPPQSSIDDILFSSLQKVGALGLFEAFKTDLLIVKEESVVETQVWKHIKTKLFSFEHVKRGRQLKDMPSRSFLKNCYSESSLCYDDVSVYSHDVDWSQYDIVICQNTAIPYSIIQTNPHILWCYYINDPIHKGFHYFRFGYDCYLNQECDGKIAKKPGNIDFPFSFLGPTTLEDIIQKSLQRPSQSHGIFAEINSVTQRPVLRVPQLEPLEDLHPIRKHQPLIRDNLTELYDAKYFVKLGGRDIRGNSVLEAISCGTLVLIDPDAMFSHQTLIPEETHIQTINDIREKIQYFDSNPKAYQSALNAQRNLLKTYAYDAPIQSLLNAYNYKKELSIKTSSSFVCWLTIFWKRLCVRWFILFHYVMLMRKGFYHFIGCSEYKKAYDNR